MARASPTPRDVFDSPTFNLIFYLSVVSHLHPWGLGRIKNVRLLVPLVIVIKYLNSFLRG